ncbi:MAG: DUF4384 domain-containing protein, partial [Thermoguttaceae bacterium]|nr:DUF4384 domain-containing protein [Thermoguttaceae bacterium]
MKKQIVTIGLIVVLVLTSTVAQARRFRPRRFGVPCRQSAVQKQTKPEQVQEDVSTETTPVQEDVANESTQVQQTIIDQGSVRSIIRVVDPIQTQEFAVKTSVDHENHIYKEGEFMTVTVESTRSGRLYLFYKDAGGNVTVLFPNKFHQDNQIEANTPLVIPDDAMAFQLQTQPPFGQEVLQAVVTLKPID